MTGHGWAIDILLWIAVGTTIWCVLGMLLMKEMFEKLHYMATVATISAIAIVIAVVLQEGWGQAAFKAILVFVVGCIMNAVLTHATARAARVREFGHWNPQPHEKIAGLEPPDAEEHD